MDRPYFLIKVIDVGDEKVLEKKLTNNTRIVTSDFREFLYQQYLKRRRNL